jgi:hypothetical protein
VGSSSEYRVEDQQATYETDGRSGTQGLAVSFPETASRGDTNVPPWNQLVRPAVIGNLQVTPV